MRKSWIQISLMVLAAGCNTHENGPGFFASGTLSADISDTAGMTGTTGFTFAQSSKIDPMLPPGGTQGYTGSCDFTPSGRTVHITRVGWDPQGLREATIILPAWSQDACTDCSHGQIQLLIGDQTYAGTEIRGTGTSSCTFTSTRRGSDGMSFSVRCNNLTAPSNGRTASITANLTFEECDGSDAR